MKLLQLLLGITIGLSWCQCGTEATLHERLTNRKQKKLIEGSMNLSVDPCDDFYKYACGNWDQHYFEAGTKYYETESMLGYIVDQELSKNFNNFELSNKPNFIKQAYAYYKSCASLETYDANNYSVWLKENDGFRWTFLLAPPKNQTNNDWVQMLAKMRTYGFNDAFIQQNVLPTSSDVNIYIVDLDKPEDGFQPMTNSSFQTLIESLAVEVSAEECDTLWQEIEEFERKLQELDTVEDIEYSNMDYEKGRLVYLKNVPIQWLKDYLSIVLNQTQLNDEYQIYIQNIPYMKALDALTKQYSSSFLYKYLEIRFLWYLQNNGPSSFIDEDCLHSARHLMPIAMHWQYEQYHPELLQEYSSLHKVFNKVREHFSNTIAKNKYDFNATVIQHLQNKLNHIKLKLNNVPRTDTIATLENFYHSLDLQADNFYENHLKLLRFNFLAQRHFLEREENVLDYFVGENDVFDPYCVPYFIRDTNTIYLPLTLLQQPIYSPGLDDIYKFSSMGFIMAHEMFHGFDDYGLLNSADGNMVSMDFENNLLFNTSHNCLLKIDPKAITEKIADISGLRYAYQAYFDSHPEASNKTTFLHGKEISFGRLFFLNFVQFFCGTSTVDYIGPKDIHGTDSDRVRDALSHFPEFAKEFKCNNNHSLYPHETCHLW